MRWIVPAKVMNVDGSGSAPTDRYSRFGSSSTSRQRSSRVGGSRRVLDRGDEGKRSLQASSAQSCGLSSSTLSQQLVELDRCSEIV